MVMDLFCDPARNTQTTTAKGGTMTQEFIIIERDQARTYTRQEAITELEQHITPVQYGEPVQVTLIPVLGTAFYLMGKPVSDDHAENLRLKAENEHLRNQLAMSNVDALADELEKARADERRAIQAVCRLEDKLTYWQARCKELEGNQHAGKKPGVCELCGSPFTADPHGHKRKRFCSAKCRQRSSRETRYIHELERKVRTRLVTNPSVENALTFDVGDAI
jgi:hypothetical protein